MDIIWSGLYTPINSKKKINIITIERNRPRGKKKFINVVPGFIKEQYPDYEINIIIVEQSKNKNFNRGKLRNIGFIESKKLNNPDYVVFQDISVIPKKGYKYHLPNKKEIIHNYGYSFCLGGLHVWNSSDFKIVNGYPNEYWHYGMEDVELLKRAERLGFRINRKENYDIRKKKSKIPIKEVEFFGSLHQDVHKRYAKYKQNPVETSINDGLNNCNYTVLNNKELNNNIKIITVEI